MNTGISPVPGGRQRPRIRRIRVCLWTCAAVVVACLGVRLFWRAAEMESGPSALGLQWRDATLGWVFGAYEPIYFREPAEQAEYWLGEVDRVLKAHPDDPALAMGAALVLDSPGDGFIWRHVKEWTGPPPFGPAPDFDHEGIERAADAFEERCECRCVELAATAARRDPSNVQRWRLYAAILFRPSRWSVDDTPRDPDWVNILDECARHDPDNALYDYLATRWYWDAAAEVDYSGERERFLIKDAEQFKKGIRRFEQGQAKPYFSVGDAGSAAEAEFLALTRTPAADQQHTACNRQIGSRSVMLLSNVSRWQWRQAEEKASAFDVAAALALCRRSLHSADQYQRGSPGMAYDSVVMASKVRAAAGMKTLADLHNQAVGDAERRQIVADLEAALVERDVATTATNNVDRGMSLSVVGGTGTPGMAAFTGALVVGIAPPVIVLLLLVGLLATLLSRRLAPGDSPVVGPIGQAVTLLAATAVSVTVFGLAPAEIIGRPVQAWCFTAALLLTPVAAVSWVGWHWLRRRRFQFSIRALFILTLIVSLFLSLLVVIRPEEGYSAAFPFPLSIPACGSKGVDAAVIHNPISARYGGESAWVAFQWTMYGGAYWTLLVWAGLLAAWHGRKARKARRHANAAAATLRRRLGGLFRTLGRPALAALMVLLIAYLALAPGVLQQGEDQYRQCMELARHPETYWAEIEQAAQRVRCDAELMAAFCAAAKAEAAQSTVSDGPP